VSAMALSVLVALVLTPALCATLLKPLRRGEHFGGGRFFDAFNRYYDRGSESYRAAVRYMIPRGGRFLTVFAVLAALMAFLFARLPSSFLPQEDQGMLFSMVQAPVGATQERTLKSIR